MTSDSWPSLQVEAERSGPAPAPPVVPPVLYLPTSGTPAGSSEVGIELRETNDGRRALLAYTALDRLADCCGPDQPWALFPVERLGELGVDYDVIYLDLAIPRELWHRPQGAR